MFKCPVCQAEFTNSTAELNYQIAIASKYSNLDDDVSKLTNVVYSLSEQVKELRARILDLEKGGK